MAKKRVTLSILLILAFGGQVGANLTKKKTDDGSAAFTEYNRGVDLLVDGHFRAAQKHFEKAIEIKEDFAEAHNNLGYALRRQGAEYYKEALKHYDRAIELDPELAQAYEYRGVLYALSGDEESARKDLEILNGLDRELGDQLLQVIASGEEPEGHGGVAARWE